MDGKATEIEMIKKELATIQAEQIRIEKLIQKQEEDDYYDDGLYKRLESLEEQRNNLELQLDSLIQ